MKYVSIAASLMAAVMAVSAHAQQPAQNIPPSLPMPSNFLFAKDVPVVPMAEWEVVQKGAAEQTGARILIAAGEAELTKAAKDAVRYDSQTFTFPTGSARVLTFKKANGGVLHQITTETLLYVVKGSATVGVLGKQTKIVAGDVVNLPSGILRNASKKGEDTTIIAYTVGSTVKDAKSQLVRGKDVKATDLNNGADPNGAKTNLKRYTFDGNSIRVAALSGKGKTNSAVPRDDVIVYIVSGVATLTVGDETKPVKAGDMIREEAAKPTNWDVSENFVFIATNATGPRLPAAPAK